MDNLVLYADGHQHCFSCNFHNKELSHAQAKYLTMPDNVTYCQNVPGKEYIPADTLRQFGVMVTTKRNGNTPEGVVCFPYYDLECRMNGIKYRNYYAEIGDKKSTWWEAGSITIAFGLQLCRPGQVQTLIICEGESDTLLCKWLFPDYDVIGISGASSFRNKLKELGVWIRQYRYIYVCCDNDTAGKEAEQAAQQVLPNNRTWYCLLPVGVKDINDVYKTYGVDTVSECFRHAEQMSNSALLTGSALIKQFRDYLDNVNYWQGYQTGYAGLNNMLGGGIGLREVITVVGHTGFGKSTFVTNVAHNALESTNVLWVSTEMASAEMFRKFIETNLQSPIIVKDGHKYVYDRTGNMVPADTMIRQAEAYLAGKLYLHDESVTDFQALMDTCYDAVYSYDIGLIVIDVITDLPGMENWETAQKQMMQLCWLAQGDTSDNRPPCSIILVAHTKQKDGRYSQFIDSADDIRGGGAIHHKSTCIVAYNGRDVTEPQRHLHLIKKPRMRISGQKEVNLEYKEFNRVFVELAIHGNT